LKVGIIDPASLRCDIVDVKDVREAVIQAGLHPDRTDHGLIFRDYRVGGVARICYEFALFVPAQRQRYFSVQHFLCAGPHVLYQFDQAGETVDLTELPPVVFYRDASEVERAIFAGIVERPVMSVNQVVLWKWPDPPNDAGMIQRMKDHEASH
jgi:hypothetical protein